MKNIIYLVLFITSSCLLFTSCSFECGVDKVQVLNGLQNYQSVIGYRRNCGATSQYTINVSFIQPEMNIKTERRNIFNATHTSALKIEKISLDTVKITFAASKHRIETKIDSMYGIKFIYQNKWDK